MLEVRRSRAHVVRCLGRREVLDGVPVPAGIRACRVARDELLLVGDLADVDLQGGLVLDETGGWAAWTLSGPDAGEAFARLSALPSDAPFIQGVVAGVPAKAIVDEGEIQLLVAASHAHHVEERISATCSDLLAQ